MALLLNIDTATENASVCLSEEDKIISLLESSDQKNHAAFIQPAIAKISKATGYALKDIDAVSVTAGPGSYTGLRVGLATAKGLCYALNKPLILINTLEVMASAAIKSCPLPVEDLLFCPMIDARRMEVFMAVYDARLHIIVAPCAHIITEDFLKDELSSYKIVFSGSGSAKMKNQLSHKNIIYQNSGYNASHLISRALLAFREKEYSNLAYSEPVYLKEFYNPALIKES